MLLGLVPVNYIITPAHAERVIVCPKALTQKQLFAYEQDASRLELLIRILYWILIGIVLWVYGIIVFICLFIQWVPYPDPGQ